MTNERATVLTSAVVAIAILGAAVTAQPSRTTSTERLAQLESDLRYQLELESRIDPAKCRQRTSLLDEVMGAWSQSLQSERDYKLVAQWLRSAIRSSLPGESGEWPAAPSFSVAEAAQPTLHGVRKEAVRVPSTVTAPRRIESPTPTADHSKPIAARAAPIWPEKQVAEKPPVQAAAPKPSRAADQAKPFIVSVSDPAPIGAEILINDAPPSAPAVEKQTDSAPEGGGSTSTQPEIKGQGDVASERPAPTSDQTAAIYNEPSMAPSAEPPTAAPPIAVNLAELNARIGGYHDGLREVEAALVALRERMSVGEIAKLVARLEELAGQYEFVQLYYEALTREERHFVITPRSLAATVELVDQRRKRLEAENVDDHFSASDEDDSELARRLRALLEAVPTPGKACCGGRP